MDLVLLKAVEKVGAEGEVVRVAPGFARNYLIPAGLAAPATPERLKTIEALKRQRAQQAERDKAQAQALKQRLESRSVTVKLALGEGQQPFGSVTTHDLVEALKQDGLAIEKHAVQLAQPIKALGVYEIPVRLHPAVTAALKVWVVKQ